MAVYACADLHGQLSLLKQIQNFVGPNDTVYFLGDAADRCRNGWQMIKDIATDSRFVYIKGNHEDMLIRAAHEYFRFDYKGDEYYQLARNGGGYTFNDMLADPDAEKWIGFIRHTPTYKIYNNAEGQIILLSHAGFTPWIDEDGALIIPEDEDLIWNRNHYLCDWKDDEMLFNSIVVHGHTPIPYIAEDLRYDKTVEKNQKGPFWYANRHKVCIDNAAFYTNTAFLLNLDTFEYTEFTCEPDAE